MYKPNGGLKDVMMSWGHDEYLYQVLKHNNTTLPEEALYMIRYHSFYPWHTGGDYTHLTTEHDEEMKKHVKQFRYNIIYQYGVIENNFVNNLGFYGENDGVTLSQKTFCKCLRTSQIV